ncbi:MAG: hypothetical protein K2W82_06025 [Candidatus Obscuribacterales bacterium]|nr:hypothetical protein [Candidatus Obscuribacterales bacterium]
MLKYRLLLCFFLIAALFPINTSAQRIAVLAPPRPTKKSIKQFKTIEIDTYKNGQALFADVGSHIKFTFKNAVPPPTAVQLTSYTEGMFAVIADGSRGEPIELKILSGSEGTKGRIDIRCENELGTIHSWSQIFPNHYRTNRSFFQF